MSNIPQQLWPLLLIVIGAVLGVVAHVCPGSSAHDLMTLATSIASAGAGAFVANKVSPIAPE